MKKNIFYFILSVPAIIGWGFFFNYGPVACSSNNDVEANDEQIVEEFIEAIDSNEKEQEQEESNWEEKCFVDEFGDNTDKKFIGCRAEGTFSNSATTNSELSVYLRVKSNGATELLLWEYGSQMVKGTDDLIISVRDEQSNDYSFKFSLGREGICSNIGRGIYLDSYVLDSLLMHNEQLKVSGRIEEYGNLSTYKFIINCKGFKKAFDKIKEDWLNFD